MTQELTRSINMKNTNKGFTLAEALLATAMVAVIIGALAYMFQVIVAGWSTQGTRMGLGVGVNKAVEEMARDLHNAKAIVSQYDGELRFTMDDTTYYVYYLYNAADSYPPKFTKGLYQVKRAALVGKIDGTFTYGSGNFITRDILPPPSSTLSYSGAVVTINLGAQRGASTIRAATKARPRNI